MPRVTRHQRRTAPTGHECSPGRTTANILTGPMVARASANVTWETCAVIGAVVRPPSSPGRRGDGGTCATSAAVRAGASAGCAVNGGGGRGRATSGVECMRIGPDFDVPGMMLCPALGPRTWMVWGLVCGPVTAVRTRVRPRSLAPAQTMAPGSAASDPRTDARCCETSAKPRVCRVVTAWESWAWTESS